MGWIEFACALCVFLLSHAVAVRAPAKPWLVAHLGPRGFTLAYSGVSVAVLGWVIVAAGRAPLVPLWAWAPWQNMLVIGVMLGVCLIVALTLGRPNPFSFGGPKEGFEPAWPGLVRWIRHPLLWALALWALSHGVAKGSLAHGIMFFGFAGFAVLGMAIIDRRRQRIMGAEWHRLWRQTRSSAAPAIDRRRDGLRLVLGVALWVGLILAHGPVLGVTPWP